MTNSLQSERPDPVRFIVRPVVRPDPNRRLKNAPWRATPTEGLPPLLHDEGAV
jgi:hypothetical protein